MNAEINRLPNGMFTLVVEPQEIRNIRRKLDNPYYELDDREITIAREFELI